MPFYEPPIIIYTRRQPFTPQNRAQNTGAKAEARPRKRFNVRLVRSNTVLYLRSKFINKMALVRLQVLARSSRLLYPAAARMYSDEVRSLLFMCSDLYLSFYIGSN